MGLTPQQVLRQFKAETGKSYILKPYEQLLSVNPDPDSPSVSVTTFQVTETRNEVRLTAKGTKLVAWLAGSRMEMTAWDESFVPTIIANHWRPTPEEAKEQREWERDCYRPGTDQSPLDSYDRVLKGAYAPAEKKIEGYW